MIQSDAPCIDITILSRTQSFEGTPTLRSKSRKRVRNLTPPSGNRGEPTLELQTRGQHGVDWDGQIHSNELKAFQNLVEGEAGIQIHRPIKNYYDQDSQPRSQQIGAWVSITAHVASHTPGRLGV